MAAVTDPARKYRSDPGHPEVCNVFRLHNFFTPARVEEIASECRSARIGCVDCKKVLAESINSNLKPFRERRAGLASKPGYVNQVLADGANRAEVIAKETIREVKEKMKLLQRADLERPG
jgi:tryptophanyl-tRNA synthetase